MKVEKIKSLSTVKYFRMSDFLNIHLKRLIGETAKDIDAEIRAEEQIKIEQVTKEYKQATAALLRMFSNNKLTQFSIDAITDDIAAKKLVIPISNRSDIEFILDTLTEEGYLTCEKGPSCKKYSYKYTFGFPNSGLNEKIPNFTFGMNKK